MKTFKSSSFILPSIIIFIILILLSFSTSCSQYTKETNLEEITEDAENTKEVPIAENTEAIIEEKEDESVPALSEEETTDSISEESNKSTASETKPEVSANEELSPPTIDLMIYQGPTYSEADGVCYYRIKSVVTGDPVPIVTFSKDDSAGAWGKHKAQVNLHPNEVYTLTASAINSEGSDTDSITLHWGCDLQKLEITENIADTSINNSTPPSNTIYSSQGLEYFFEIAFGAEYGTPTTVLHKWVNNIRIKVNGSPTSDDISTLNQVIAELNSMMGGISLSIVSNDSNVEIYFTTIDQFPSIEPNYVPGNWGFFYIWWDSSGAVNRGKILISTDKPNQQERSHLIREELTQSIGLMNDSFRYQQSIFYQGWTNTVSYAPIDCEIIKLLYDHRLKSGMTQDQVRSALDIN